LISPGGMNSTVEFWSRMPFNPIEEFKSEFRAIAMDQRNAGRSKGPLPTTDPWGEHCRDQLGVLDHLGIDKFLVMGCCIGDSYILKLIELAPDRVVAGVMEQPIGIDHTNPGFFNPRIWQEWGASLLQKRPDLTQEQLNAFGEAMWSGDFVFTADRDT